MTLVAEVESRLAELKTAWSAAEQENQQIVGSAPIDGETKTLMIDNARREAFQKNIATMKTIRTEMESLEEQKSLSEWGARPQGESQALAAAAALAGGLAGGRKQSKSIGEMFCGSDEFKQLQKSGAGTMPAPWNVQVSDLSAAAKWIEGSQESKYVYPLSPTGGPPLGFKPLWRDDIVVQAFRKVRVRDLFPVQPTTAAVIEFFRVFGFVTANAASVVPEWDPTQSPANFGLKPHTSLNFVGAQCPTRTIAHWEAAHRNVLNDVPQLQGIIDTELLYGLRLHEDYQILFGTGAGEDLLGIMNTPNIQSYVAQAGGVSGTRTGAGSGLATDTKADDVRRAATQAILAYYEPTGVVMNPQDWEKIETLKDSTGAYIVAIAVALGGEQRIWRLPVVDTPAMTTGRFLVGAFGLGATLYDREEGTIRIAEQHADFFLRNALVVLAEERIALACKRPESFVAGTFGA